MAITDVTPRFANAAQVLEPKDLELKSEETDQVRGGTAKPGQAIEVTEYGFGISMPVTSSR